MSTHFAGLEPGDDHAMIRIGRWGAGNALSWVPGVRLVPHSRALDGGDGDRAVVEEGVLHLELSEHAHVVRDIDLEPWDVGPAYMMIECDHGRVIK